MERIRSLNRYQKAILLVIVAMAAAFTAIYAVAVTREGFAYQGAILIPHQEDGHTVYAGNIHGQPACFTVDADRAVTFRYGEKTYGPYTAREDPTAVPADNELGASMTGVELRCGEDIVFRGGVWEDAGIRWLYGEDGGVDVGISVTAGNGILLDESGKAIDPLEPSPSTLLDLMAGPALTHRGEWPVWLGGMLVCLVTAISILFADELFRLRLSFRIQNAGDATPSDWEMAGRYIAWTVLPVMALFLFVSGLQ